MKLAILGGSFNPLHIAHAMLAETAVRELGYDIVEDLSKRGRLRPPPHPLLRGYFRTGTAALYQYEYDASTLQ